MPGGYPVIHEDRVWEPPSYRHVPARHPVLGILAVLTIDAVIVALVWAML